MRIDYSKLVSMYDPALLSLFDARRSQPRTANDDLDTTSPDTEHELERASSAQETEVWISMDESGSHGTAY